MVDEVVVVPDESHLAHVTQRGDEEREYRPRETLGCDRLYTKEGVSNRGFSILGMISSP